MTFGSLFAGIGGMDLGLERGGLRCVWQVEIDEYCRRVLAKHWPAVPRWDDVRTFTGDGFERPDLIAGGFPCQDISNAGRRAGIDGERSGLWSEFARIVRVVRPRYVFVENVDALVVRGLDRVLGDLAALGFDAEWDRIPAAAVGAPHRRWRVFLLAYAGGERRQQNPGSSFGDEEANGRARRHRGEPDGDYVTGGDGSSSVADGVGHRLEIELADRPEARAVVGSRVEDVPDTSGRWSGQRWRHKFKAYCQGQRDLFWPQAEPPVCGVADGVPDRVDRLRGLGNAVVPQVAEWIGRRLIESEGGQ